MAKSFLDTALKCLYICIYHERIAVYEWDDEKNRINLSERGLSFEDAEAVFAGPCVTFEDTRQDYGEQRFITFGLLEGRMVVIAHTPRGESIRIISMRKGNDREQKTYQERLEALGRDEG